MEVMCSSETSVDFEWTTRRYIPEDSTLYSQFVIFEILVYFIKKAEMIQKFFRNAAGKKTHGIPIHKWEDDIKIVVIYRA
jgi:hypothetical protein